MEEVPAAVPGFDDGVAVPVPEAVAPVPELPHPETIPAASIAATINTVFVIDFIISPWSVVAPALDNKKPGLGIE